MEEWLKKSGGIVLVLIAAALAIGLAGYGLWQREQAPKSDWERRYGFPTTADVVGIAVWPMASSETRKLESGEKAVEMAGGEIIDDPAVLAELMQLLHQAPRTGFGDPEPSGRLYALEMRLAGGGTANYAVNDQRVLGLGIGSKIYPLPSGGREEVWLPTARTLELLVGPAQAEQEQG